MNTARDSPILLIAQRHLRGSIGLVSTAMKQLQQQPTVLLTVRPVLLADVLRKALASDGAIEVVVEDEVGDLPWRHPWDVAVLSTDALSITEVTDDAYVVCVPGETPTRVRSPNVDELVALVRRMALGGA